MISYNKLLVAPSRLKKMFIYALLRVTGNYKEMHGLLVTYKANPLCSDSTKRLYELYDVAKGLAINLISEFRASAYVSALGLDSTGLLLALLVTQIVAFPCAIIFGRLSYKVSTEKLILVCIVAYLGI
mgnify:CR=1 FL=1